LLRELDVLVLDCQASGASPAHGDLLELGWAVCGANGLAVPPRASWIVPRSDRGVSRIVRKLTGWDDSCLAEAMDAAQAWSLVRADASGTSIPTVIHFARFELAFLRELHARADAAPFPLDTVCLHAISQRLFPELPRRNLRALAGHLGHSPSLFRRSAGHVDATAFIWRAIVPRLEALGARTWDELKAWLDEPAPPSRARGTRPGYPLTAEQRRALPDTPGVYRFLRPNGDVLYVGKAASLKKRVASHFKTTARATERALEMLTQAHHVEVTPTATALEAALLETDEIKRLDPPYNVQLRTGVRQAWFASRDWSSAEPIADDEHRVGPLPSRMSLAGIGAMRALLDGRPATDDLRAAALGVSPRWAPDAAMFDEAWSAFASEHLAGAAPVRTRILHAAARIVIEDTEPVPDAEDAVAGAAPAPDAWDPEAVTRSLERTIVQEGLLVRRARALSLLSHAVIAFREPRTTGARLLVVARGEISEQSEVDSIDVVASRCNAAPPSRAKRQAVFDAPLYDRLRVLATELRRIADTGGSVAISVGRHLHGAMATVPSNSNPRATS
jgi:DNA polymerase-3 subunit epsilon